jgi:hypothetical protein
MGRRGREKDRQAQAQLHDTIGELRDTRRVESRPSGVVLLTPIISTAALFFGDR